MVGSVAHFCTFWKATFVPNHLPTSNSRKVLNLKHFCEKWKFASIKLGTLFHSIFAFWEIVFTLQDPFKPRPGQSFCRKPVTAPVVTRFESAQCNLQLDVDWISELRSNIAWKFQRDVRSRGNQDERNEFPGRPEGTLLLLCLFYEKVRKWGLTPVTKREISTEIVQVYRAQPCGSSQGGKAWRQEVEQL